MVLQLYLKGFFGSDFGYNYRIIMLEINEKWINIKLNKDNQEVVKEMNANGRYQVFLTSLTLYGPQ